MHRADHIPVLVETVISLLHPAPGGCYIDATAGAGGHTAQLLERSGPDGRVLAVDADPCAVALVRARLSHFGTRLTLANAHFDQLRHIVQADHFMPADGIVFDLGMSSMQLSDTARGFSFQHDSPLDMRFGPQSDLTAADIVNHMPEDALIRIFSEYGQEFGARRIARRIVAERRRRALKTTNDLVKIAAASKRGRRERIHPATRIFQALRIAVNDELAQLVRALPQALDVLRPGGRLAVISFHSLEDRIVKMFFAQQARGCICQKDVPECVCNHTPALTIITRKPITPDSDEMRVNPRARSAKLRVAEKIDPAHGKPSYRSLP